MDDGHPGLWVIVFLVLLVIDAVFSGSVSAVGGVSESRLRTRAEEGDKKAASVLKLLDERSRLIVSAHLVEITAAVIAGASLSRLLYAAAVRTGNQYFEGSGASIVLFYLLFMILLIYLFLVIGVVTPKRLATKNSERWLLFTISPLQFLMVIICPFARMIMAGSDALGKILRIDLHAVDESVTEEEIILMVSEGHEQGVLEENEAEMINNIFEFNDKEVGDIMTHRKDIVAVDIEMDALAASQMMISKPYSRFPVYEGDVENIVGILHLKDMMRALSQTREKKLQIRDIMRAPYYVPDTQNIDHLFKEMKQRKIHMAIVIDEYGQTAGLIAMEDILEEIVGNIFDEYDLDEDYIRPLAEDEWIMQGSAPLDEVGAALAIDDLDDGEFDTLNGLLVAKLGHIPDRDEQTSVELYDYVAEVLSVDNNMIQEVHIIRKVNPETVLQEIQTLPEKNND